jgi:hypothetical protein
MNLPKYLSTETNIPLGGYSFVETNLVYEKHEKHEKSIGYIAGEYHPKGVSLDQNNILFFFVLFVDK